MKNCKNCKYHEMPTPEEIEDWGDDDLFMEGSCGAPLPYWVKHFLKCEGVYIESETIAWEANGTSGAEWCEMYEKKQ